MKRILFVGLFMSVLIFLSRSSLSFTAESSHKELRAKAYQENQAGNFKQAYEIYEKLALDPNNNPKMVTDDLVQAVYCLRRLNRADETDDLRERVIAVHGNNWRLLSGAATSYFDDDHNGFIVAGKFQRSYHRGGGQYVNAMLRDRIRALQLMTQALAKIPADEDKGSLADFYLQFARLLMGYSDYNESWRLQYLSDLSQLPDYEEGNYYQQPLKGAPVDGQGRPLFHALPKTYRESKSDGERWRWMLQQAMQADPHHANQVLYQYANFLRHQFDVQTMADYYSWFYRPAAPEEQGQSKTYQLHTLKEDETLARLATGIQRFKLPEDANYIRLYQQIADIKKDDYSELALAALAEIFENRRQYERAAEFWRRSIKEYGPGPNQSKQKRLDQILGNWGQFEPLMTHPAGKAASVEYRFRNGRRIQLTAHAIRIPKLLADVKQYLDSNPARLDWDSLNIADIGYRLVAKKQSRYIGEKTAEWALDLQPLAGHFDQRIAIQTPLKKAGAYLLSARMQNGNTSQIVIWLNDTVIVKKPLDQGTFLFIADAVSGRPLPDMPLEFFGYQQKPTHWQKVLGRQYNVLTTRFDRSSDALGQLILTPKELSEQWQWLITATDRSGRLAYLGFSQVWHGGYYEQQYHQVKAFTMTDRPVYRPGQPVQFKFWVRQAQYDMPDTSSFSRQSFTVRIHDPQGQKVFEKACTSDAYGGLAGEYPLPADAVLGQYAIDILNYGGGSFRVEEYKKPEFEVKVEAPQEPIQLGEKFFATIAARYYFGAPVTKAKVKYKVLRASHQASWYPIGIWDWFYGPGYGWFAYDYEWYPGWRHWGCKRPIPWWWPASRQQPELVAEAEAEIDESGTFKIEVDTSLAKEMHGDQDHRYEITAEVTDPSRRTIVGQGRVLAAREPFKVYAWVDRGHYRVGDVVQARFSASTLNHNPVQGQGELKLLQIQYRDNKPVETQVQKWSLATDAQGQARMPFKASAAGQYRLSYAVTDAGKHTLEGGYIFCVQGEGFDGKQFRFNEIELLPDKTEYRPDEKVRLMIHTDQMHATVLLFTRPSNGIYLKPKTLRLAAKSALEEIGLTPKDMPNFFVEALTVSNGQVFSEMREIAVPPVQRVLNVEVLSSAESFLPGQEARVRVKLSDLDGRPFKGSTVLTVYDKSLEYISGGGNVPAIKEFFWKWRRQHYPHTESSLDRYFPNLVSPDQEAMRPVGVFGQTVADDDALLGSDRNWMSRSRLSKGMKKDRFAGGVAGGVMFANKAASAPVAAEAEQAGDKQEELGVSGQGQEPEIVQPQVRQAFADTAFWAATLETDDGGIAEVRFKMPENLTTWLIKSWAMGQGTRVGEGRVEVVTFKNLVLRLQAPRFFVEKDEVVLSANIHNYLQKTKQVKALLELEGGCLETLDRNPQTVEIASQGQIRVDWRVKVLREGEAVVRMKALTDQESDAVQMKFPVYVHGMLKTESFSGAIRRNQSEATLSIQVPRERRIDQTRLELRYSPTLAGAMVDALPYLVDYPYGCTEQTLNRFLPTVITRKILKQMGLDLKAIQEKRTNLNAQETGDDPERAKQWQRWNRNPVFDEQTVNRMIKQGLQRLANMQLRDGGWGWFSGWGEESLPHTTAYVVQGFLCAQKNDMLLPPDVLERGIAWLEAYQKKEVQSLKNAPLRMKPYKGEADNLDAFVYKTLAEAGKDNPEMRNFLYRDRKNLSLYGKALFGVGLHLTKQTDKLNMILKNIEQYLVEDPENQTAYLNLSGQYYWWYWYGSEFETQAYYLKLLALTDPRSDKAAGLAKYLLNHRKHATYWNSTRDTALCIEALADYLKASAEDKPDMTLSIYVDGQKKKEVTIKPQDLFTFDNKLVLSGKELTSGPHEIKIVRQGTGPVYFNAYLANFTLEDFITKTGLEIKVERKYYKLKKADKTVKAAGSSGQALDQKVEKYERELLQNLSTLKSGDLVEIELEIESKNDYEYLMFEDLKAAGFEPVEVQSGYTRDGLAAYMELRDERVCFFLHSLARGKHSLSYRMRAEIPGRFSALPTRAQAMYAPELKANSDEIKIVIED